MWGAVCAGARVRALARAAAAGRPWRVGRSSASLTMTLYDGTMYDSVVKTKSAASGDAGAPLSARLVATIDACREMLT